MFRNPLYLSSNLPLPSFSNMRQGYLFLYNMVQWGGWVMIFLDFVQQKGYLTDQGQVMLYTFQLLAILEFFHALLGIVRTSPITTFIQVFGRLQVLLIHHNIVPEARDSVGNVFMIAAWSCVEIVRYLFLALNVIGVAPYPLLWLRYSLFYILYPIGVYGEMKVIYDSLDRIESENFLSYNLPNAWNIPFSFATYLRVFLYVLYIPGLVNQYTYMMKQRRVVLMREVEKKTS
jgi:very-long-chain (3R)-3-hydroxyacyl-CoA dehydratase